MTTTWLIYFAYIRFACSPNADVCCSRNKSFSSHELSNEIWFARVRRSSLRVFKETISLCIENCSFLSDDILLWSTHAGGLFKRPSCRTRNKQKKEIKISTDKQKFIRIRIHCSSISISLYFPTMTKSKAK